MLKIGIPSKGRLMEKAFEWFGEYGIIMRPSEAEREYTGYVEGVDGLQLAMLSASEIPQELASGRIHMGVTGSDLVYEKLSNKQKQVKEIAPMGFGYANLVLAVPNAWIDVSTLEDLDEVAADFRLKHGFRLRIATKYHRLVREFLTSHGIANYQLVDSQGATEGTVKNMTAEAIADITSSGETLTANHLKILEDGLIHQSQATLFLSLKAPWAAKDEHIKDAVLEKLNLNPV